MTASGSASADRHRLTRAAVTIAALGVVFGDIGTSPIYIGRRTTLTDGRLALYVAPDSGRLDALMFPVRVLLRRLEATDKFEVWRAATVTMDVASRDVRIALDGEVTVLTSPLRFQVAAGALRAIVPADEQTS